MVQFLLAVCPVSGKLMARVDFVTLRGEGGGIQKMNPFVAHLIGDFILQNDWMAANKKQKTTPCLIHIVLYLTPFLFTQLAWWQIILIGVQHFAQDRTEFVFWWMRSYKRVHPDHWKELPLYVDQAFHIMWIEIVILLGTAF